MCGEEVNLWLEVYEVVEQAWVQGYAVLLNVFRRSIIVFQKRSTDFPVALGGVRHDREHAQHGSDCVGLHNNNNNNICELKYSFLIIGVP